jgi:hypothetical protein
MIESIRAAWVHGATRPAMRLSVTMTVASVMFILANDPVGYSLSAGLTVCLLAIWIGVTLDDADRLRATTATGS